MAENSKIEWTSHTFNPWRGCTKISEGCKHCYAETLSKRNPATLGIWGDNGTRVVAVDSYWKQPLKWNREAECYCGAAGMGGHECAFCANGCQRPRVFCASLADVFEDRPELTAPRDRLFQLIDRTPNLDWLLLTKRPQNIKKLWPWGWYDDQFTWPNVWVGTTVENQEQADRRIPELLKIPAKFRFLSCEPLIGSVNLAKWLQVCSECGESPGLDWRWTGEEWQHHHGYPYEHAPAKWVSDKIHWVIAGGESGANARPVHPDWLRFLRDQCQRAGVAFHFKQWGEWGPQPVKDWDKKDIHWLDGVNVWRVGKKAAGRILDGRTWDELPAAA